MTPSEFKDKMRELCELSHGDPEAAHGRADKLICEVLKSCGYEEGVAIFQSDDFDLWYA